MIVLFHSFLIVTKYILTVISKSISCRSIGQNGKHAKKQNVFSNDETFVAGSHACFEEGTGVTFYPPVYVQRYTAVKHVLQDERWLGKIRKVVDFGCAEFGFFVFMKHLQGVQEVLTVDIDREILEYKCCRVAPLNADYLDSYQRPEPLVVRVLNGSIAERDPRLLGTDAVVCIELIEHLYPDTLEEVPYTVFGYIQPLIAIFTTPNSDFNVVFPNLSGFRHFDHKFEWTRSQFEEWALNIETRYPAYSVKVYGIGKGPPGTECYGCCSQMAVFIKNDYGNYLDADKRSFGFPEVHENDLVYEEISHYEFPYHVDNRTDNEKILHEAEYYIRQLALCEYTTDKSISIPLQRILPFVEKWCTSKSMLKEILEDAGLEIFEEPCDNEIYVIYSGFVEESSIVVSEDFDVDVEDQRSFIAESMEDDWDKCRDTMMCGEEWGCSGSAENTDCELQEDTSFNSHSVKSGMEICSSSRDNNVDSESVNLNVDSDALDTISLRTRETIDDEHSKTSTTNMQLCSKSSPNSAISQELDKQSSNDLEPKQIEQAFTHSGHKFSDKLDGYLEIDKSNTPDNSECSDSMELVKIEGRSYNEALTKRKLDELEEVHRISPHNVSSENSRKSKNVDEDLILDKIPQYVFPNQQTLSANSSDCNKVNYSFDTIGRPSAEGECEEMRLNFVPEISNNVMVHQKSSQSLCVNCATPSILESSQERSLVESISLDEQNDVGVDSGYPNTNSVQDMDMDLTPEQVDEIYSESEEIASDNSNSYSVESDSESGEENNHDHNRLINNDGFMLNFRNELLYDPVVHAVENGDVANNNRDGEGNNAVAVVPLLVEPEIEDQIDHEFIPLLAAAEDFDNDNDLILPEDGQPFPHWLLNLLGLVHPVNGGGDLHNYLQPPGPPVNILPDEGLGDDDNEEDVANGSNSSDLGEALSDFNGSEVGSDWDAEELEGEEIVVPGDVGGGGEPDSFHGQQ